MTQHPRGSKPENMKLNSAPARPALTRPALTRPALTRPALTRPALPRPAQFGRAPRPFAAIQAAFLATALCASAAAAQTSPPTPAKPPIEIPPAGQAASGASSPSAPKPDTHITPEQAKQLFSLVDELIKFSSAETGLPIKSAVNRRITSRAQVEAYLKSKFEEDEGAKRMQRDEIVLKKFGLLDRDFELKPFLLALLTEQVEAYYDSKTKTVNMLDWVDIDEQKPVLAHELTHALQDQRVNLDTWDDQTPDDVSTTAAADNDHLAKDEVDTARDAVIEGQATAVMMDYILKPMGKSLVKDPEVMDFVKSQMSNSDSSPVLARAPLLLSESLLFPYREGLSFEQDIWMDKGTPAAFAGTLDRPPTSTWEIMNPRRYEQQSIPTIPLLPNIHPLLDKLYKPYDIGQVGQLDLHILAGIFGGEDAARDLTPAWNGGIYWAGQRLAATPAEQASTKSLALFYLSAWRNSASADAFSQLYAKELGRKYSGLKTDTAAQQAGASALPVGESEQVFSTSEGPVLITTRGKLVFVAESFPLETARKLTTLVFDAQGSGELKMAKIPPSQSIEDTAPGIQYSHAALTGDLAQFISQCGVMKAAVSAAVLAAK
jgi:hypothetical protein